MRSFSLPALLAALALSGGGWQGVSAQTADNPKARLSRTEIEAAIVKAEKIASSPGYSSRIKRAKRQEIALLKSRLSEGDLQPGDQVILSVQGEKELSDSFTVSANRYITLPAIVDVSLRGVLRSEVENHIATEIRKYLKNPVVHVRTTIRVSVLGAVGRPGFYQLPSEAMVGDAIMLAGGPAGGIDPAKTRVQRSGTEIVGREAFSQALTDGKTLDQMNLQAGDEIIVGGSRTATAGRNTLGVILPVLTGVAGLGLLIAQIF